MTAAYFEDHPTDPDKVILRKPRLDQGQDYERGFIDGMQYQMQTSVDKAVNAMSQPKLAYLSPTESSENACYIPPQRTWVGLTDEEIVQMGLSNYIKVVRETEAKLKEKNNG
jgi:hypothetical protein